VVVLESSTDELRGSRDAAPVDVWLTSAFENSRSVHGDDPSLVRLVPWNDSSILALAVAGGRHALGFVPKGQCRRLLSKRRGFCK